MRTESEFQALEANNKFLESEVRKSQQELLDVFAAAALASGRYSATKVYDIAITVLEQRDAAIRKYHQRPN